jgi:hypothetical protein
MSSVLCLCVCSLVLSLSLSLSLSIYIYIYIDSIYETVQMIRTIVYPPGWVSTVMFISAEIYS